MHRADPRANPGTSSRHRRRFTALDLQKRLLSKPPQHISPHRCVKFRRTAASATQVPLGPGQYPVLYSKKLHHLEPPYGIEP